MLLEKWTAARKRGMSEVQRKQHKATGREANRNVVHQMDLTMRAQISQKMHQIRRHARTSADLKICAQKLNEIRLQQLAAFKERLSKEAAPDDDGAAILDEFVEKMNKATSLMLS